MFLSLFIAEPDMFHQTDYRSKSYLRAVIVRWHCNNITRQDEGNISEIEGRAAGAQGSPNLTRARVVALS